MAVPIDFIGVIKDQTLRTLWSLNNVIDSIPDAYWEKEYCEMPLWKHVYHTLHSLDMWYINPLVYEEPSFHTQDLNDLDVKTNGFLSRELMKGYYYQIKEKIISYLDELSSEKLLETPPKCQYTRFNLILAQHRHLDMHIGMLMGYVIAGEGMWPRILGLQSEIPVGEYSKYF
ncbi:MAG: hypothetical protein QM644_12130 [Mobilitalea sp.]